MDIISYNQFEIDSNLNKFLSRSGFDKNPKMTRYISKLSDQYDRYKESYNFPTKYMGRNNFKQAKRLKSCKIIPEVDRLDGQWAQWPIGLMVNRLDG